jgi:carbon storage regulator
MAENDLWFFARGRVASKECFGTLICLYCRGCVGPGDQVLVRQQSFTKKIDQGLDMLVLSRKKDEKIVIGDSITLMVIEIRGDKVRLGIEAPRDVTVHREEVYEAIKRENTPDTKQS